LVNRIAVRPVLHASSHRFDDAVSASSSPLAVATCRIRMP
jgi:hypothetical protein